MLIQCSDRITRTISFLNLAFLITVANAGQYGNDFYIAPEARLQDGLFHVVVMKPLRIEHFLGLLFKILRKRAHQSPHIETFTTNSVTILRQKSDPIHFDGDPAIHGRELVCKNHPNALRVIVGEDFQKRYFRS